jgi:hypothetical protein
MATWPRAVYAQSPRSPRLASGAASSRLSAAAELRSLLAPLERRLAALETVSDQSAAQLAILTGLRRGPAAHSTASGLSFSFQANDEQQGKDNGLELRMEQLEQIVEHERKAMIVAVLDLEERIAFDIEERLSHSPVTPDTGRLGPDWADVEPEPEAQLARVEAKVERLEEMLVEVQTKPNVEFEEQLAVLAAQSEDHLSLCQRQLESVEVQTAQCVHKLDRAMFEQREAASDLTAKLDAAMCHSANEVAHVQSQLEKEQTFTSSIPVALVRTARVDACAVDSTAVITQ